MAPREQRLAEMGLRAAITRIASATSEDDALIALHEALGWVYSLHEWHKKRLTAPRFFAARDSSPEGQTIAAMVWARAFAVHQLALVSDLGDVFSDVYTEMFGVLVWRKETQLPTHAADGRGRDALYRSHLEDRPVPDTLLSAERFVTQQITELSP